MINYCGVGSEKKASRYASTDLIVDDRRSIDVIWRIILATVVGVPGQMWFTPGMTILIQEKRDVRYMVYVFQIFYQLVPQLDSR